VAAGRRHATPAVNWLAGRPLGWQLACGQATPAVKWLAGDHSAAAGRRHATPAVNWLAGKPLGWQLACGQATPAVNWLAGDHSAAAGRRHATPAVNWLAGKPLGWQLACGQATPVVNWLAGDHSAAAGRRHATPAVDIARRGRGSSATMTASRPTAFPGAQLRHQRAWSILELGLQRTRRSLDTPTPPWRGGRSAHANVPPHRSYPSGGCSVCAAKPGPSSTQVDPTKGQFRCAHAASPRPNFAAHTLPAPALRSSPPSHTR
jgi:hypothetical protein